MKKDMVPSRSTEDHILFFSKYKLYFEKAVCIKVFEVGFGEKLFIKSSSP